MKTSSATSYGTAVRSLALIAAVAVLAACAGMLPTAKKVSYPSEVSAQMRADFDQAEGFYLRRQFDEAFHAYSRYLQTYPYNRLADEASYKQGKIHFLKREYARAVEKFNELAQKTPDPQYRAKAWHMAGYAHYKAGDAASALAALEEIKAELLPAPLRLQYYSLLAFTAESQPSKADLADYAVLQLYDLYDGQGRALQGVSAPDVLSFEQVQNRLDAWVKRPMASAEFPRWLKRYPSGAARAFVDYKMALTLFEEGQNAKARRALTAFVNSHPKNRYAGVAQGMLSQLGGPDEDLPVGERVRVGVLLPLGGQFSEAALRGIRCAAGTDGLCGGEDRAELIIQDAGHAPDMVRSGIDQLTDRDVAAIIAVLPGTFAVEAAMHASSRNVPILMVSQQEGLMRQGDAVYQIGFTPERQIAELAETVVDRGLKNIAIFYPNIAYGDKMAELFSQALQQRGGRVVAKVSYNKGAGDFIADAARLKNDIDRAAPASGTPVETGGTRAVDAIFIPDAYNGVNAAAGALESAQLSGVPLIGTNAWNDPGLSASIGLAFPGSFYIDLYDGRANSTEVEAFRSKYAASFGGEPGLLQAMAYDAMSVIQNAAATSGSKKLKASLSSKGFRGVTGVTGFKPGEGPVIRPRVIALQGTP